MITEKTMYFFKVLQVEQERHISQVFLYFQLVLPPGFSNQNIFSTHKKLFLTLDCYISNTK